MSDIYEVVWQSSAKVQANSKEEAIETVKNKRKADAEEDFQAYPHGGRA